MTLLTEIIDGASGNSAVPTLLRQLKVVAARTGAGRLAEWVTFELEGYESTEKLPTYRGPFEPFVLGHFMGPFGSEVRNVPIPPSTFPEDVRDSPLFKLWVLNSVAELEVMAKQESVNNAWPADAVRYYNFALSQGLIKRTVREGMVLATASRPVTREVFVGILDAVRNRVLDLALELERVAPDAGQPDAPPETKGQAARTINNFTFYATSNVAVDSSDFVQAAQVTAGDEASLLRALRQAGVGPHHLAELQEALAKDRADAGGKHPRRPGARVMAWLASASTQVGTGAAGGLITEAVKAFFGG